MSETVLLILYLVPIGIAVIAGLLLPVLQYFFVKWSFLGFPVGTYPLKGRLTTWATRPAAKSSFKFKRKEKVYLIRENGSQENPISQPRIAWLKNVIGRVNEKDGKLRIFFYTSGGNTGILLLVFLTGLNMLTGLVWSDHLQSIEDVKFFAIAGILMVLLGVFGISEARKQARRYIKLLNRV